MDILEDINFQLKKPIQYAYQGETIEGKFITLISPTRKQMEQCVFLKQTFFQAAKNIQSDAKDQKEESEKIKGQDIISLLYSSNCDMNKVLLNGIALFRSGAAKIEGVKDLTAPMIDQMSQDDLENSIGEYIANFIVASLMNQDS